MAEGKKSFVAYADWKDMFFELPDAEAGQLIKHIFSYVNDENPVSESVLINALFAQIKSTLKRDLRKWETQLEQRKKAGLASAEARKAKMNDRSTSVDERERNSTDSVSVSVINNNIQAHSKKISDVDAIILCLSSESWLSEISRVHKIPENLVPNALQDFKAHRVTTGYDPEDDHGTLKEFKSHFSNWVRTRKYYKAKGRL